MSSLCLGLAVLCYANLSAEEGPLGRDELLSSLRAPVGSVDELVLTRVGWEDLLDRYPSLSEQDLPKLRYELRVNPNPRDYRRLVRLLHRLSRLGTADRTAREAARGCQSEIAVKPTSSSLQFELGLAFVSLREYGRALQAFGEALELGAKRPEEYAAYALACLSVGQLDTADATLSKALEAFPDRPEVLVAAHYVRLNANCRESDALAKAAAEPDSTSIQKLLALDELRRAAEADPGYVMVRRTLGSAILDVVRERARQHTGILGSLDGLRALSQDEALLKEGLRHLDAALGQDPLTPAPTLWRRAVGAILSGDQRGAEDFARRALSAHLARPQPGDAVFKGQYVAWRLERGEVGPAQEFLAQDAHRVPTPEDLARRGACAWKLGQLDHAERWGRDLLLAQSRPLSPDERRLRAAAHAIRGACALSRGDLRRAGNEYQTASRWSLDLPWATYGLAVSQLLLGEREVAIRTLTDLAGRLARDCPAQRLLAALVDEAFAREAAARNRKPKALRGDPAPGSREHLRIESDWLLALLSLWRTAGPRAASEQVTANPEDALRSVHHLIRYWDRPDFPEPKLDLLAAARLAAAVHPDPETQAALLAELRELSQRAFGKLEFQALPEDPTQSGAAAGTTALRIAGQTPFAATEVLAQFARASVQGCADPLEKAHALSTWLTLRPTLDFSSAVSVGDNFARLLRDPRSRFTLDEKAALFIAAARSAGLEARFVSLPRIEGVRRSAPSGAGVVLEQGLLLVAPELGVFGGTMPGVQIPAEQEVRALFYALLPGEDRADRCRLAAKECPRSARIQLAAAEYLLNQDGGLSEAAPHASAAVQLAPDLSEAQVLNAAALEMLGRRSEADAAFRRAVRLDPESEVPFQVRGLILARRGEFAAAAEEFRAALEIKPHQLDIRASLAACLAPGPDKKAALEEGRRVLLQDDTHQEVRMLLLDLFYDLKMTDDLLLELEELLAAQPENTKARKFLIEAYRKAGQNAEAESLERQP